MNPHEKEVRQIQAEQIIKKYPAIGDFINEVKTKTLYGKFMKVSFSLTNQFLNKETYFVKFYFNMFIKLSNSGGVSTHRVGYSQSYRLYDLEETNYRGLIVDDFDYKFNEVIKKIILEFDFDQLHFLVRREKPYFAPNSGMEVNK
jgi:hypothetical protein